jgi:hypothetical protein
VWRVRALEQDRCLCVEREKERGRGGERERDAERCKEMQRDAKRCRERERERESQLACSSWCMSVKEREPQIRDRQAERACALVGISRERARACDLFGVNRHKNTYTKIHTRPQENLENLTDQ